MKTFMKPGLHRLRPLVVGVATSVSIAAVVIACTEDTGTQREGFDTPDASPDVVANLPPSTESDAGFEAGREPRPPFDPADEPVACATDAGACAVELVAGRNHFCARMSDGTVKCWGDPMFGATGETFLPDGGAAPPVRTIAALTDVTQLSAAGATTCARLADGSAKCWGDNRNGQLALSADSKNPSSDSANHPVPSQVAVAEPIARIDVGERVVCAVLASGKVWCWGDNQQQQVSPPSSGVAAPTELALGSFGLKKLAIGTATSFGLTADGKVTSWGALNGRMGLLGGRLASISPDGRPALVDQLHDVTSFVASTTLDREGEGRLGTATPPPPPPGGALPHAHACAIAAGEVYCWGNSDFGALCTGLFDMERVPAHAPINGKAWPQQLAAGDELTCARMTDGTIQCCGVDHRGRLGVGFSPVFVPVEAFEGHAVRVATSHRAICALVQGGSVECWGSNQYGELGQDAPDQDAHPTPVKVSF